MNPLFLEDRVKAHLHSLPAAAQLTSTDLLRSALPEYDFNERTPEIKGIFHMLRRSAAGRLVDYVTRGDPYIVNGMIRRPYIWHTRPQSPSPEPDFTELGRPDDLNDLRDRLQRIEEKLDRVLQGFAGFDGFCDPGPR